MLKSSNRPKRVTVILNPAANRGYVNNVVCFKMDNLSWEYLGT